MYFKAIALCSTEANKVIEWVLPYYCIPYLRCYEVAFIYVMTRHLYISPASDEVHDRHFENGVVKVQCREERTLFSAEKAALAYSKSDAGATIVDDEEVYFINRVYAVMKAKTSAYRSLNHVAATSNCVERLFSRA